MEDKENKTEEATPKRLRDAKKKGQVAKSGDLISAVSLFIFTILAGVLGQYVFTNGLKLLKNSLSIDYGINLSFTNLRPILINSVVQYFILFAPIAIIAMILGIIINLVQTGFIFTTDPLKPDFKRLNPIEGFKNIFSKKSMFTLGKNMAKLVLVFYMTYRNLSKSIVKLINSGDIGSSKLFYFFIDFIKDLSLNIAFVMLMLGIVDYVFERREYKKNLRMSKQELKDEYKEMEGNPEVKAARQQRQRQIAMGRMMTSIEDSTVVVTNPTHIAVVLKYDSEVDQAPKVVAKGAGHIAEKIKEIAREHDIPIMENKPLARAMYKKVEIGEYLPVELYKAVAEILAMVYEMKRKNKGKI
ncbi:MAG: flagellar biosynthesis protein FlhB [Tissierellaceae bacterium]